MNKSIYVFAALAAVAVPSSALAQNLDPTVEVNRTYEGKMIEVHKPSIEMAVPDSVLRFDLDFDYSVFENPYKGAYEFRPYVTDLQPVKGPVVNKSLYLKAGMGLRPVTLSVMPVFDLAWTPVMSDAFKMNVYAGHDSYVGRYMNMPVFDPSAGLVPGVLKFHGETGYGNYDLATRVGADGRYDWDEGVLRMDVAYLSIAEKYKERADMFNSLEINAATASKDWGQLFSYEVKASYSFGKDRLEYEDSGRSWLTEHDLRLSGVLKATLTETHKMSFDLGVDNVLYYGEYNPNVSRLTFAPRYHIDLDRLDVDAGFRIEAILAGKDQKMFASKGQYIYPDVYLAYHLIPDAMKLYARVGGGTELNTFGSLIRDNHHLDLFSGFGSVLMDNTVERVSATAGLKGRAGVSLAYEIRGGYSNYANALLDRVLVGSMPGTDELRFLPAIGYASYSKTFVEADFVFKKGGFESDGHIAYAYSWFTEDAVGSGLFLPAALNGDFEVGYNWGKRVYAGLDCVFSTSRSRASLLFPDGTYGSVSVPGYADLGVNFEYLASRKFSFWFRGGNLLNMAVQRNLLYAEKGPYLAVGICLNL